MASLPSATLSTTLKLEPEFKTHPSPSFPAENSTSIAFRRTNRINNTQLELDGSNSEPIKQLELQDAISLIQDSTKIKPSYYVPLLKKCLDKKNSVSETRIIHAHMIKTGTHQEVYEMTFLVNVYAKCGVVRSARQVFDNLPKRNVVAWTTLMAGYIQNSQSEVAIDVFQDMLESGSLPSNITLGIALNACAFLGSVRLGKQFHGLIVKYAIEYDTSIGNALSSFYSKFNNLESTTKAFRKIRERNVISWTAVISACGDNGKAETGLGFFVEMLHEDAGPNEYTLTSVLSLCSMTMSLGVGIQVHAQCIKLGYDSNLRIMNSIMYVYLKYGYIEEAQNLFYKMESVNLVTWNAIIAGHTQAIGLAKDDLSAHRSGTEAFMAYVKLQRSGMKADMFTLSSMFTVCGKWVALEQGEQIHAQTIKSGFLSDVVVGTALMNMYNKCGSIETASKAFIELSTRTLISWTSMITGFAQHGLYQQALLLFEDMRVAGLRPNQITFVGVLAACSHGGMVEEALGYFDMMHKDYKIKPAMDHYGCLIDMFVRLGRLDEAFDIVEKMDMEPSEFIWLLLIAGCRNHGNEKLGFYAANQLLNLRPKDSETYVMLNMYISAERWKDVSRVRKIMKEEKIGKLKDRSRISIKGKTFSFKTSNLSHLQNAEMYRLLDEMLVEAKSLGYELQHNMELIDEEEEEKEELEEKTFYSAVYHSEKLAVAFGLLNTPIGAPIRVVKSITMCKDCHNFLDAISSLTGRQITIRDSKRLHKFVDGRCSCKFQPLSLIFFANNVLQIPFCITYSIVKETDAQYKRKKEFNFASMKKTSAICLELEMNFQ